MGNRSVAKSPQAARLARVLTLVLPAALGLSGCGDFPRPFQGNPGPVAARLAQPPPPLLAVPSPSGALLSDTASHRFSNDLAKELAARTVPAIARSADRGDWELRITASLQNNEVVPRYTVIDPDRHPQGSVAGKPVAAKAWANADPAALGAAAAEDAPKVALLLTDIDGRIKHSNPASLMNRPAKVWFAGVVKAPGDGDLLLASAVRKDLADRTLVLMPTKKGADFSVLGEVQVAPAEAGRLKVELQWVLSDANGRERGRVVQLNEVPAATIEPSWAEVAPTIADQAALGLRQLIEKARVAP
ncbi:MAG: hypothetical protein ACREFJ_19340 [Acetobacteraceae bacterium]